MDKKVCLENGECNNFRRIASVGPLFGRKYGVTLNTGRQTITPIIHQFVSSTLAVAREVSVYALSARAVHMRPKAVCLYGMHAEFYRFSIYITTSRGTGFITKQDMHAPTSLHR